MKERVRKGREGGRVGGREGRRVGGSNTSMFKFHLVYILMDVALLEK